VYHNIRRAIDKYAYLVVRVLGGKNGAIMVEAFIAPSQCVRIASTYTMLQCQPLPLLPRVPPLPLVAPAAEQNSAITRTSACVAMKMVGLLATMTVLVSLAMHGGIACIIMQLLLPPLAMSNVHWSRVRICDALLQTQASCYAFLA
jgi:hypothetical protein